jgi:exopolysaccharide production protein ExoY
MLRKSSLDELPQLFNILRGDMSCVGPRPIVTDELERYGDHVGEYLRTRPGLTGLWQVTGRSSTDYANRVALDSQYVREWSTWIDLLILVRTVFAVMRFDRAS